MLKEGFIEEERQDVEDDEEERNGQQDWLKDLLRCR